MAVRSFFDGTTDYESIFNDIPANAWYADAIKKAVEKKLIYGVENGNLHRINYYQTRYYSDSVPIMPTAGYDR